jgi:hemoglobin-like flavoprotein
MFVIEMVLIVIACVVGLAMVSAMVWMLKNSGNRITKKEYKRLLAKYGK